MSFSSIELFAGAGGLALGLEKAGFNAVLLNEIDKQACATLRHNRPQWNIVEGGIEHLDFTPYRYKIDFVSGGFPCQSFSYAGKQGGFDDVRGTLFFEFARAVGEIQPAVFLAENVRGLLSHDGGRTLATIKNVIADLGYTLVGSSVLKAMYYRVPQKRERLFLVGVRNDLANKAVFTFPKQHERVMTLRDGLKAGELYDCDVPESLGQLYPPKKKAVLDLVPAGGCWRHLPEAVQREYMKKSYFLGGGKTGMARRLSWDEASLTLTCAPAQNQTERCHPDETRPLTVREYARIQTFPDNWQFMGSMSAQYKQIGNAVPVNLAHAVGNSLIDLLNCLKKEDSANKLDRIGGDVTRLTRQVAYAEHSKT
ncbi:MAG: DNA (cytosine-5-)-methyltransferase [Methylococcales bacterium]